MTQKKILELFDELDLSSLRHNFEIVNNDRYLNEEFSIEQEVGKYSLDIQFKVQWEFEEDLFILTDVIILDAIIWDYTINPIIKESSFVKIEKILKNKINELT